MITVDAGSVCGALTAGRGMGYNHMGYDNRTLPAIETQSDPPNFIAMALYFLSPRLLPRERGAFGRPFKVQCPRDKSLARARLLRDVKGGQGGKSSMTWCPENR